MIYFLLMKVKCEKNIQLQLYCNKTSLNFVIPNQWYKKMNKINFLKKESQKEHSRYH